MRRTKLLTENLDSLFTKVRRTSEIVRRTNLQTENLDSLLTKVRRTSALPLVSATKIKNRFLTGFIKKPIFNYPKPVLPVLIFEGSNRFLTEPVFGQNRFGLLHKKPVSVLKKNRYLHLYSDSESDNDPFYHHLNI